MKDSVKVQSSSVKFQSCFSHSSVEWQSFLSEFDQRAPVLVPRGPLSGPPDPLAEELRAAFARKTWDTVALTFITIAAILVITIGIITIRHHHHPSPSSPSFTIVSSTTRHRLSPSGSSHLHQSIWLKLSGSSHPRGSVGYYPYLCTQFVLNANICKKSTAPTIHTEPG